MVNLVAINLVRWLKVKLPLKEVMVKLFVDKGYISESRSIGRKQENFI